MIAHKRRHNIALPKMNMKVVPQRKIEGYAHDLTLSAFHFLRFAYIA
jgi:hypothetical protein